MNSHSYQAPKVESTMLYSLEFGPAGGDPVMFLHAGSYSGTMWREIAKNLPGMRCLLPDLPGHGLSRNIKLRSLEQAADALAALIVDKYDSGPVHLVGLSFGGYVGLVLMARHPRLVRRSMLSGIHLGSIPSPRMMNLMAALMSPLIRLSWFRREMAEHLGVTDPEIYNRADGSANLSPRTFRAVLRLVSVFNVHELLPKINVPTLMIAGENEHSTIVESLYDFQRLMPDCTARIVPEMGHAWCNQDPCLFTQTVAAWLHRSTLPRRLDRMYALRPR